MNIIRTSVLYRFGRIILLLFVVVISLSSLCKNKPDENYLEPVNVSNNSGRSENPSIAVDSRNTVHLVWNDDTPGNEEIYYAYKPANGNWSTPINISNTTLDSRFPCIKADRNDNLHLVWQDFSPDGYWRIFYSQRPLGGNWSVPETITGNYMYVVPKITVDDSGDVHLIWKYGGYYPGIRYVIRTSEGMWGPQVNVIEPIGIQLPSITVDKQRNVHLTWYEFNFDSITGNIFYAMKLHNGNWLLPENISNTGKAMGDNNIITDNLDAIYCIWKDDSLPYRTSKLFFRAKRSDGTWTSRCPVCTLYKVFLMTRVAKGPIDELYLFGYGSHKESDKVYLLYVVKPRDGNWSDTLICGVMKRDPRDIDFQELVCNNEGRLYFIGIRSEDIFCIEYKRHLKNSGHIPIN